MSSSMLEARGRLAWPVYLLPYGEEARARFDKFVPFAVLLLLATVYALAYKAHPLRPTSHATPSGWFTWFDAGKYFRAALAWTRFDLSSAEHWYAPGYPWLGA